MNKNYYEINESNARRAKGMYSFSDYVPNSTTLEYRNEIDEVYKVVEKIEELYPDRLEKAEKLADKYSKLYADWINKENRIQMMCPSIFITGTSNFPVKKKEKQNQLQDKHMKELDYINNIKSQLLNILYENKIIKSSDEDAIKKLEEKILKLKNRQEFMKKINAYYRKNHTLDGCDILSDESRKNLKADMKKSWHIDDIPFQSYELSNNLQNIRSTEKRLENIKVMKKIGTLENNNKYFKCVKNTELMRLQLFFDEKPNEQIRNILKANAFKWSPKNLAWQRQLTNQALYSLEIVNKQISDIK